MVLLVFDSPVQIPFDVLDLPEILFVVFLVGLDSDLLITVDFGSCLGNVDPPSIVVPDVLEGDCLLFGAVPQLLPLLTLLPVDLLDPPNIKLLEGLEPLSIDHGVAEVEHVLSSRLRAVEKGQAVNTLARFYHLVDILLEAL